MQYDARATPCNRSTMLPVNPCSFVASRALGIPQRALAIPRQQRTDGNAGILSLALLDREWYPVPAGAYLAVPLRPALSRTLPVNIRKDSTEGTWSIRPTEKISQDDICLFERSVICGFHEGCPFN